MSSAIPTCRPIAHKRDERCHEVYNIQVQGLTQRLRASGINKLVIGISGGLDSTHALLVCARAMDALGLPRSHIIGVTMPGFATGTRTLDQALRLMRAVGCEARQIDIRPSCEQMLKDLGHPYAEGKAQYDITFENVQAGERTSHLFRLANFNDALVVGTGDLSELALGWSTYGVGDHMSHYNVNASVPKTLIKHLVRWVAESDDRLVADAQVLLDILDTEISPELVPGDAAGQPGQSTESQIGPYDLHDFFLYYILRFGFAPSKVAYLAHAAWHDAAAGAWPEGAHVARQAYDLAHHQAPPAQLRLALLQDQPVQAQLRAECAQGGLGRFAVAARRLARAQRRRGRRVAGGPGPHSRRSKRDHFSPGRGRPLSTHYAHAAT